MRGAEQARFRVVLEAPEPGHALCLFQLVPVAVGGQLGLFAHRDVEPLGQKAGHSTAGTGEGTDAHVHPHHRPVRAQVTVLKSGRLGHPVQKVVHDRLGAGDVVAAGERGNRCADEIGRPPSEQPAERGVDATEAARRVRQGHADGRLLEHVDIGGRGRPGHRPQDCPGFGHKAPPPKQTLG